MGTTRSTSSSSEHSVSSQSSPQAYIPPQWAPRSKYPKGAVVTYAGCYWRCEIPHTSAAEAIGAPTSNLLLWTPFVQWQPTSMHGPPMSVDQRPLGSLPPPPSYDQRAMHEETAPIQSSQHMSMGTMPGSKLYHDESSASNDPQALERELRGESIWKTGGVGVWSHSSDNEIEMMRADAWDDWGNQHGRHEWLNAARARTDHYSRVGPEEKPPVQWRLVEKSQIPDDAIPVGHESDRGILFASRAWWDGGLHLGKAATHFDNRASISYAGQEHVLDVYEVLCGPNDPRVLKWVTFRHGEKAEMRSWQPVEGGRERNGRALLLAKGEYADGVHPGKCLIGDDHACMPWGGGETWVRPFQILAYALPGGQ